MLIVGQRVEIIDYKNATVFAVHDFGMYGSIYELTYDDGGSGYWPEECLIVITH